MGIWVVFLGFGVLLVSSCSFLVSFCSFLLLGGLGGFPGVCGFFLSLVVFLCLFFLVYFVLLVFVSSWFLLFLSCSCLVSSCSFCSCFGGPGWFSWGLGFFLFLSCLFFLFHFFLFGGPGWFSWGLGVFLVPVLFLIVPFLLVLGAWVVFLGFGGSSCFFLVSSSRRRR